MLEIKSRASPAVFNPQHIDSIHQQSFSAEPHRMPETTPSLANIARMPDKDGNLIPLVIYACGCAPLAKKA